MSYVQWLRSRVGHRKVILTYATAIIRDDNGRILFQRRSDFDWWGLPGGVLEIGERLADCAAREAYEETGLVVEPLRLVGVYSGPQYDVRYPNGDEVQQWTAAFEGRLVGGRMRADGEEVTAAEFFEPDSLPPRPHWYADMARDALAGSEAAVFERPRARPPDGQGDFIHVLRSLVGQERLILPGAVACIRDEAGRVLLLRRRDTGAWHPPSGFMDLGESVAETVVREMREETGLQMEPMRLIGVYSGAEDQGTYPNGDQIQNCSTFFECQVVGGELRLDGRENTAAQYFPPEALPESLIARWRWRLAEASANLPRAIFR